MFEEPLTAKTTSLSQPRDRPIFANITSPRQRHDQGNRERLSDPKQQTLFNGPTTKSIPNTPNAPSFKDQLTWVRKTCHNLVENASRRIAMTPNILPKQMVGWLSRDQHKQACQSSCIDVRTLYPLRNAVMWSASELVRVGFELGN